MMIVTTYGNFPKSAFQLLLHFYNFSSEVFYTQYNINNLLMLLQENYDTNYLVWARCGVSEMYVPGVLYYA